MHVASRHTRPSTIVGCYIHVRVRVCTRVEDRRWGVQRQLRLDGEWPKFNTFNVEVVSINRSLRRVSCLVSPVLVSVDWCGSAVGTWIQSVCYLGTTFCGMVALVALVQLGQSFDACHWLALKLKLLS